MQQRCERHEHTNNNNGSDNNDDDDVDVDDASGSNDYDSDTGATGYRDDEKNPRDDGSQEGEKGREDPRHNNRCLRGLLAALFRRRSAAGRLFNLPTARSRRQCVSLARLSKQYP